MRTDGGTGVNRIGVVGPLVDQLVLLLAVSCTDADMVWVWPLSLE